MKRASTAIEMLQAETKQKQFWERTIKHTDTTFDKVKYQSNCFAFLLICKPTMTFSFLKRCGPKQQCLANVLSKPHQFLSIKSYPGIAENSNFPAFTLLSTHLHAKERNIPLVQIPPIFTLTALIQSPIYFSICCLSLTKKLPPSTGRCS